MKLYLSYQDVCLRPERSIHQSRSEIDTSTQFGFTKFKIPVIPANMKCTINQKLAHWMSQYNYFYIMHRFGLHESSVTPEDCWNDNFKFIEQANLGTSPFDDHYNKKIWNNISISIGVQEGDKDLLKRVIDNGYVIDFLNIDIAHSHSIRMEKMLKFIKSLKFSSHNSTILPSGERSWTSCALPYTPYIIAGNAATPSAVIDLESWGADCVKCGIAQGNACTSYGQTGFGLPMFSCILECAEVAKRPIIADGGVRTNGDFAKALVAGGTMVMAGSMFANSIDSPAETVVKYFQTNEVEPSSVISPGLVTSSYKYRIKKQIFKRYYGSASSYNKHSDKHVEGTLIELECDGTSYEKKLKYIEGHLQSALSYSGGNFNKVKWEIIYNNNYGNK
jgi:GMP reductase